MTKKQQEEMTKTSALQWHPAFYAGIQIEFEEEADKLTFMREYPLATKPVLIDVLIIKKDTEEMLKKNIGRIFRKHNIIEYKSPKDTLTIKDFYKVYAYACHYISLADKVNGILAEDLTITFVSSRYPNKMLKHLKTVKGLEVSKVEKGIYYILGDTFPMQFIVTKKLSRDKNLWLRSLTFDLKDHSHIEKVSREYRKHRNNELYKSVMNIIIRANKEQFEEEKDMCEAIVELFQDEIDAARKEALIVGRNEGLIVGRNEGLIAGRNEGLIAGRNEGLIVGKTENLHITNKACRDFGGTKEKVYELLVNEYKLTGEQAEEYIEKYW